MKRQGVGLSVLLVISVGLFVGCAGKMIEIPPGKVVISEVVYHPIGPEPANEKIALENVGGQSIDIGGWRLTDGEGNYRIPKGTTVEPDAKWVVTGSQYNPTGYTRGMFLANDHDSVELYDENRKLVDSKSW